MSTKVTFQNEEPSAAERSHLREISGHLARYFRGIVSIDWNLSREGRERVVGCKVHSKSGYYRAQAGSETFGKSADAAIEKLLRQRRRRKAIGETARRAVRERAIEAPRMQ